MKDSYHFREPSCCHYPPRVNEPVQETRLQVEIATEVVLDLLIYLGGYRCPYINGADKRHTEVIRNHVQRLCIVLHLRIQTREIEPVENVVLLDFTEVFIAF